ncbi:hypothetical protein PYCC9005_000986 [Savitreella phatthalungensis]
MSYHNEGGSPGGAPLDSKRTNSLGRAAADCFACQKLKQHSPAVVCDRQRPRCNVCTSMGKVCSGYHQEFQWQGGAQRQSWTSGTKAKLASNGKTTNGRSAHKTNSNRPSKAAILASPRSFPSQLEQSKPQVTFEFIQETFPEYVDCTFADVSGNTLASAELSQPPALRHARSDSTAGYSSSPSGDLPSSSKRRKVVSDNQPTAGDRFDWTAQELDRTPSRSRLSSILNDEDTAVYGGRMSPSRHRQNEFGTRGSMGGLRDNSAMYHDVVSVGQPVLMNMNYPGADAGYHRSNPAVMEQQPQQNWMHRPNSIDSTAPNSQDMQMHGVYGKSFQPPDFSPQQFKQPLTAFNAAGSLLDGTRRTRHVHSSHSPADHRSPSTSGSISHEIMSHAPAVAGEGYDGSASHLGSRTQSNASNSSPTIASFGLRQQTESHSPDDVKRSSWHEVVGSPAASAYPSPMPLAAGSPLARELTADDDQGEQSRASLTTHDSSQDLAGHAGAEEEFDELLPRHDEDDDEEASNELFGTSLTVAQRKSLTNGFLSLQPAWHSMTSYDLQRIQHFDRFICPVPVTFNAKSVINPYREVMPYVHHFPALKEAVLAAGLAHNFRGDSYKGDEEIRQSGALAVSQHKTQSFQLFRQALMDTSLCQQSDGMLITAFILVLLEAVQTGRSNWKVHFDGIARLLDARGGVAHLVESTVLQAQLAMLVWYDCSIALVGRKAPCIPPRYMDALCSIDSPGWSFFALTGCVSGLVRIVYRFCELASDDAYRVSPDGRREIADLEDEIEKFDYVANVEDILEAKALADSQARTRMPLPGEIADHDPRHLDDDQDDEDALYHITDAQVDEAHDRMHGAEVWKHALLLYACREFHGLRGGHPRLRSLARRVVDHARLIEPCPRTGVSKQLLLPLLLAAAEEKGAVHRTFIRELAAFWNADTRFGVWTTALEVLDDLWDRQAHDPSKDWSLISILATHRGRDGGDQFMFG